MKNMKCRDIKSMITQLGCVSDRIEAQLLLIPGSALYLTCPMASTSPLLGNGTSYHFLYLPLTWNIQLLATLNPREMGKVSLYCSILSNVNDILGGQSWYKEQCGLQVWHSEGCLGPNSGMFPGVKMPRLSILDKRPREKNHHHAERIPSDTGK